MPYIFSMVMNSWIKFDLRFHTAALAAIVVAVLCVPLGVYLPVECGYENGVVENVQMAVLALGVYFCLRAGNHRQFFVVAALVLVMLMLREVNCGRTLFFAKPGTVNEFYKWREIPYGWVARVMFGLYISGVTAFFLWKKLYLQVGDVLRQVAVPVWNVILMAVGMSLGIYGERVMNNMTVEEFAELGFYVALVGGIHIYARCKGKAEE